MRNRPVFVAAAVVAVVAVVAACSPAGEPDSDAEPEPPAAQAPALDGTAWVLAALEGRPPVAGSRVTLEIEGRSAGGFGGCNSYGGTYRGGEGGNFAVDSINATMRACVADGVTEQESAYLAALGRARRARVQGERLELTDAAGTVLLAFTRRERRTDPPGPSGR